MLAFCAVKKQEVLKERHLKKNIYCLFTVISKVINKYN